jgi:hypothetical protein
MPIECCSLEPDKVWLLSFLMVTKRIQRAMLRITIQYLTICRV